MLVECLKPWRVYVPSDAADPIVQFNLRGGVDLQERDTPGGDGTPIIVDPGCGAVFEIPDGRWGWDVNTISDERFTDAAGVAIPVVVERHLAMACPSCGRLSDHLSEPVDAVPLAQYDRDQADEKLERELGVRLDQLSDDIVAVLRNGVPSHASPTLEALKRDWTSRGWPTAGLDRWHLLDALYGWSTESAVALSAATAKTIVGMKAHANSGMQWTSYDIGFDGVSASAVPVLVECVYSTWGANAPGTNSTSTTARQSGGRALTAGFTNGKNWTTEPTTLTSLGDQGETLLTPNGGRMPFRFELGKEPDCALAEGFAIRCTAPAAVNVRAIQAGKRC